MARGRLGGVRLVTMVNLLRTILVTLSATALLGACGGTPDRLNQSDEQPSLTKVEYQKAIWEIRGGPDSSRASQLYSAVVGDLPKEQCSEQTQALHDHLAAVTSKIAALRPPADAVAAQRQFLDAANESVRLVGVAADDVEQGTLTCGRPMNDRIYGMPSTKRAEEAIQDLEKLGYTVLGN